MQNPNGSAQSSAVTAIRVRLAAMSKSQAWLADQIGESPWWLSRRMSGQQRFTTDDLDRIAAVFGTDIFGLLDTAKAVA